MGLVGNIEDLKWVYEQAPGQPAASPARIDTPNLEVRVIVLKPGAYPPYHAHHAEVDEGYLIYGGRGLIHTGGETFRVGRGDVSLTRHGAMHHMKNTGEEDLVEFNFRGGRMPSGFILPENEDPYVDPESVNHPAENRSGYIRGTVDTLKTTFDPATVQEKGLPRAIATEHLHLQIVTFPPGARPHLHRHLGELDEATLVLEGRMNFVIGDDTVEAGTGDLVHVPGGTWHTVRNDSGAPATLFNFRGGRFPAQTEWP